MSQSQWLAGFIGAVFLASSPTAGEGGSDLEEEVLVVSEAVGHWFDDVDRAMDTFQKVCMARPAAVGRGGRGICSHVKPGLQRNELLFAFSDQALPDMSMLRR